MRAADEFLDLYKRLEQAAINIFDFPADGTAVSRLERLPQYKEVRQNLKYCREVRALLSHNPKVDGKFAVEPSPEMLLLLRRILSDISSPEKCIDRAVVFSDILRASLSDKILTTMEKMKVFGYSYIPITDGKRVLGLFGKSTVFKYLLDSEGKGIGDDLTFSDIKSYISLNRADRDTYRFIPKDMYVHEAEHLVLNALHRRERINIMFITETGERYDDLLGIITPWDVIS